MEQIADQIRIGYADPGLNGLLKAIGEDKGPVDRRFSQGEDFFLHVEPAFTVPHFQVHHDVHVPEPSPAYLKALTLVMEQVSGLVPQVFKGLTYYFDPTDILRPSFYHVYRIGESLFLYLLRMDLVMKPSSVTVIERATNETTASYTTHQLFLESIVIPLAEVEKNGERVKSFKVRQTISQTWIGEFGRGYFQQGIWMDADLTKFFSRLFLPADKRIYPYYPFQCKYKTVCEALISLDPEGRAAAVPMLHRVLEFLGPVMERIQEEIKSSSFSEELVIYRSLKGQVPQGWYEAWQRVKVERYLNQAEMKEYKIEI